MTKRWSVRCNIIMGILATLCFGMIVTGCKKHDPAPSATTPQQVLKNMRDAIIAGDKEAFIDCFDVRQIKRKEAVGATYELVSAMRELDQALVHTYGRGFSEDAACFPQMFTDESWPEKVQITIEGNAAKVEDKGVPQEFLKIEGVWKIKTEMPPDWQDFDVALGTLSVQAKAVEDMRSKVGQPAYSAERIEEELLAALKHAFLAERSEHYDDLYISAIVDEPGIDTKPAVIEDAPERKQETEKEL